MLGWVWRRFWGHPAIVWLLVLAIIFATEAAVMLVLPALLPAPRPRLLEAAIDAILLVTILAPVIWGSVVRPLREIIRLRTRHLSELLVRIEADRRRTAHELHDGIGQSLSLLVSGLRSAHATLHDPEAIARCGRLLELAQTALKDTKRLALGLRPSMLDDLGLAPALERLVDDVRTHDGMKISLETEDIIARRFPEAVETAVFRLVQEALANVIRHAKAKEATVAVTWSDGRLRVEVEDDGQGMAPVEARELAAGHLGLVGMQERVALLGGELAILSEPGRGTCIRATLPVQEQTDERNPPLAG